MITKHPDVFTEDKWLDQCKPLPNPYTAHLGFDYGDGSCLFSAVDLQNYITEHNLDDSRIWSVIEDDDDLWISHGFHLVNNLGYFVTENAPRFTLTNDIRIT